MTREQRQRANALLSNATPDDIGAVAQAGADIINTSIDGSSDEFLGTRLRNKLLALLAIKHNMDTTNRPDFERLMVLTDEAMDAAGRTR